MKKFLSFLLYAFCFFLIFQRFFLLEQMEPYFVDEVLNLLAGINFLKSGVYGYDLSSGFGFEKSVSSGLLATLPSAIAWEWGGNLFWSRLFFFFYNFLLFIGLWSGWQKYFLKKEITWFSLSIGSMFFIFLLFCVPYARASSIYLIGEIPGVLWLGLSLLVLPYSLLVGCFLLGLVLWHIKFIYLPYIFIFYFYFSLKNQGTVVQKIGSLFKGGVFLILPLLLWFGWIGFTTGGNGLEYYFKNQESLKFSIFQSFSTPASSEQELDPAQETKKLSFSERLSSPDLEWSSYDWSDKFKIIFLLLIPFFYILITALREVKRKDILKFLLYFSLAGLQLTFAIWYFFFHVNMRVRHIQPAFLVGWGVLLVLIYYDLNTRKSRLAHTLFIAIAGLMMAREVIRIPQFINAIQERKTHPSYSQKCSQQDPHALIDYTWFKAHCSPQALQENESSL